jgi:hypothetical protein
LTSAVAIVALRAIFSIHIHFIASMTAAAGPSTLPMLSRASGGEPTTVPVE